MSFAPFDLPAFSLPFESLPGMRLIADGIRTPFRAGILTGDSLHRVGIVRIPSFEELADEGLCLEAWKRDDVWDPQGKLLRSPLRRTVEQHWYETLADILRTFKSANVSAVVVDVGNNSGGDDSGDIAARLFTALQLHSAPLWMSQDSAASAAYFDEQLGSLREAAKLDSTSEIVRKETAHFLQRKSDLSRNVCDMGWVWHERRSWARNDCRRLVEAGSAGGPLSYLSPGSVTDSTIARIVHWPSMTMRLWGTWTGPLYVLTDNRTYSAAEMFSAVLQNNKAAKTIGIRTGGDGCGFMNNPGPVILPHSQLRFRLPNCVRIRSDGGDEVAGIIPDIPVLPTDAESSRARAKRVFDEVLKNASH